MKSIQARGKVVYCTRLADASYPGIPDEYQAQVLTVVEGENLRPAGKQIVIWFESGIGGPSFGNFTVINDQRGDDVYAVFRIYEDGRIEGISISGSPEAYRLFQKAVWPE